MDQIILPGQISVAGRGYEDHALFDSLQAEGKSFVIRIKAKTTKTVVQGNEIQTDSIVFFDAEVLLGTAMKSMVSQLA